MHAWNLRRRRERQDADFREWAAARQLHLRRAGHLLCRDWHFAEDLTQITLTKVYAAWPRIRPQTRDAYARKVLYRAFLDETRRGRNRHELLGIEPPEPVGADTGPETRLDLLDALALLPPRSRAVLMLRFWEDQSVEDTAATLGCGTGTVKSQTSRGLTALRQILASSHREFADAD